MLARGQRWPFTQVPPGPSKRLDHHRGLAATSGCVNGRAPARGAARTVVTLTVT